MFLVLNKLNNVAQGFYQKEDTLNQLAFRVYSTQESFSTKSSQEAVTNVQRPIIRSLPNKVINRTPALQSSKPVTTESTKQVENRTSEFNLVLSQINLFVSLPSLLVSDNL